MYEQQELEITYSKITKIVFIRCQNCDQEPICHHAGYRKGCRIKECLMEVKGGKEDDAGIREDITGD